MPKFTTLLSLFFLFPLLTSCSLSGSKTSNDTPLTSSKPLISISSGSIATLSYRLYSSGEVVEEGSGITLHVGKGEKFPAFDTELLGMKAGEKKSTLLDPSQAYGDTEQEDIVRKFQITRSDAPGMEEWFDPDKIATGATTTWNNQEYTIKQILDDEFVVLSHSRQHPLAGKSLTMEVEIKSVE